MNEQYRLQALYNTISLWSNSGFAVESINMPYAILSKKESVSHFVHFLISLFFFPWVLVWLFFALNAGTIRHQLYVDENAKVHEKKL